MLFGMAGPGKAWVRPIRSGRRYFLGPGVDDQVGKAARGKDQLRVRPVGSIDPGACILDTSAERDMPGEQPGVPAYLVCADKPALIKQAAYRRKRAIHQQVVAFGYDQADVRADCESPCDRLLDLAPENRRVYRLAGHRVLQAPQQSHVAGSIEWIKRSFAVGAPKPDELDIGKMEPIHRHDKRPWSPRFGQGSRQC